MSFSYFFNDKILECLSKAGWYHGRNVDFSELQEKSSVYGINFNEISRSILKEFWGLVLVNEETKKFISFKEVSGFGAFDFDVLEKISSISGKNISAFGCDYDWVYLVSGEGKFIAISVDSNQLIFYRSFVEIVEQVFFPENTVLLTIPLDEDYNILPQKEWRYFDSKYNYGRTLKSNYFNLLP